MKIIICNHHRPLRSGLQTLDKHSFPAMADIGTSQARFVVSIVGGAMHQVCITLKDSLPIHAIVVCPDSLESADGRIYRTMWTRTRAGQIVLEDFPANDMGVIISTIGGPNMEVKSINYNELVFLAPLPESTTHSLHSDPHRRATIRSDCTLTECCGHELPWINSQCLNTGFRAGQCVIPAYP